MLSYPKLLGRHEDKPVMLNKGKFGFYLQYDGKNIGLEDNNIDIQSAVSIINMLFLVEIIIYNTSTQTT